MCKSKCVKIDVSDINNPSFQKTQSLMSALVEDISALYASTNELEFPSVGNPTDHIMYQLDPSLVSGSLLEENKHMNKFENATAHVRHTLLDAFEFQASICQVRLPTWGFKDVNQWFDTLESDKYVTPNGFISYDKEAVYFECSVERANSRDLFQLGLDGSNPFEIHHMYRTWMFLRFAPLSLITSKEMTKWANNLLQ